MNDPTKCVRHKIRVENVWTGWTDWRFLDRKQAKTGETEDQQRRKARKKAAELLAKARQLMDDAQVAYADFAEIDAEKLWTKALEPAEEALRILDKWCGPGSKDVLDALQDNAQLRIDLKNWEVAAPLCKRTVGILVRKKGKLADDTYTWRGNYAFVLKKMGTQEALDESENLLRENLEGAEKKDNVAKNGDSERTAGAAKDLGEVCYLQRKLAEAEELQRRVLRFARKVNAFGSEETLAALGVLSKTLMDRQSYEDAEACLMQEQQMA